MTEEEQLNLSGKTWLPIPRVSRTVPFGYEVREGEEEVLYPVLFELEALERAKEYRRKKYSYSKIAIWLSQVTGRPISIEGLRKRIEIDGKRTTKAVALANLARKYKETLEKAKETDTRLGNDTSDYDNAFRELLRVSALPER